MTIKEKALALVTPPDVKPGRYKPPDKLLAFLEALSLCRQSRPREITPRPFRSQESFLDAGYPLPSP